MNDRSNRMNPSLLTPPPKAPGVLTEAARRHFFSRCKSFSARGISALLASTIMLGVASAETVPAAEPDRPPGDYSAQMLLDTSTDILGSPFRYPDCPPRIESMRITLAPGETGKTHQHLTPLYGFILAGEVSVDYENGQTRVYKKGEALIEAMDIPHFGYNAGSVPAEILTVYLKCQTPD